MFIEQTPVFPVLYTYIVGAGYIWYHEKMHYPLKGVGISERKKSQPVKKKREAVCMAGWDICPKKSIALFVGLEAAVPYAYGDHFSFYGAYLF